MAAPDITQEAPPALEAAGVTAPPRRLDFIKHRNWFFGFSLLIIIPGIISMITKGFLLGIDFQGGTEFFIHFNGSPSLAAVSTAAGPATTVEQTAAGDFVIRTSAIAPLQQRQFEDQLASRLNLTIDQSRTQVNEVGPTIASEIVTGGLIAIVVAALLILAYLSFRFRKVPGGFRAGFQFGGSALLALLHDIFLLTGVFSILGAVLNLRIGEIDSFFLTAVLTVVGFSVHDTIVVFDRIRENLIVSRRLSFEQVANLSIMQTAARSIITSFTVVIVLLSLLLFGGDSLRGFALALLIGIVSGTYSSIFNATPLLAVWRRLQPVT
ncbi:MAG TPA: protein translocase subunit SecF [Candidatus Dormibacteraeota bacterium]